MNHLILVLSLLLSTFGLNGQSVYYNNVGNNKISEDSVLTLISNLETLYTGHSFSAVIIDSKSSQDSLIQRIVFEKSRFDRTNEKIRKWRYLSLIGQTINWSNLELLDSSHAYAPNKATVVNFWFTACRPCQAEIPFLNQLQQEFDSTLNFVAISFEPGELVARFLDSNHFDFDHYVDGQDLIDSLGIEAFPVTFLLDKNSRVIKVFGGFNEDDSIKSPKSWNADQLIKGLEVLLAASTK